MPHAVSPVHLAISALKVARTKLTWDCTAFSVSTRKERSIILEGRWNRGSVVACGQRFSVAPQWPGYYDKMARPRFLSQQPFHRVANRKRGQCLRRRTSENGGAVTPFGVPLLPKIRHDERTDSDHRESVRKCYTTSTFWDLILSSCRYLCINLLFTVDMAVKLNAV